MSAQTTGVSSRPTKTQVIPKEEHYLKPNRPLILRLHSAPPSYKPAVSKEEKIAASAFSRIEVARHEPSAKKSLSPSLPGPSYDTLKPFDPKDAMALSLDQRIFGQPEMPKKNAHEAPSLYQAAIAATRTTVHGLYSSLASAFQIVWASLGFHHAKQTPKPQADTETAPSSKAKGLQGESADEALMRLSQEGTLNHHLIHSAAKPSDITPALVQPKVTLQPAKSLEETEEEAKGAEGDQGLSAMEKKARKKRKRPFLGISQNIGHGQSSLAFSLHPKKKSAEASPEISLNPKEEKESALSTPETAAQPSVHTAKTVDDLLEALKSQIESLSEDSELRRELILKRLMLQMFRSGALQRHYAWESKDEMDKTAQATNKLYNAPDTIIFSIVSGMLSITGGALSFGLGMNTFAAWTTFSQTTSSTLQGIAQSLGQIGNGVQPIGQIFQSRRQGQIKLKENTLSQHQQLRSNREGAKKDDDNAKSDIKRQMDQYQQTRHSTFAEFARGQ